MAQLLQAKNRLAEAEPLFRRALAIFEQSYGDEHPDVTNGLNNLAVLLSATNRLAEAEPLMRRMVGILLKFTQATGHQHPNQEVAVGNYHALIEQMKDSCSERSDLGNSVNDEFPLESVVQTMSHNASAGDDLDNTEMDRLPRRGLILLATRNLKRMTPSLECLPSIGDAVADLAARTLTALEDSIALPAMSPRPSRSKLQKAIEACIQTKKEASRQMNLDLATEIYRVIQFLTSLDHAVCIALARDKQDAMRFSEKVVMATSMTKSHRHAQQVDLQALRRATNDYGWTDDTSIPANFLGPLWPDNNSNRG